jgi:hypothetical protein
MQHSSHVVELVLCHFKSIRSHNFSAHYLGSQFHSCSPEKEKLVGPLGFTANLVEYNGPKEPVLAGMQRVKNKRAPRFGARSVVQMSLSGFRICTAPSACGLILLLKRTGEWHASQYDENRLLYDKMNKNFILSGRSVRSI